MTITKEAIEAAKRANTEAKLFGGEPDDWVRAALEAALPFLSPIAGEGKAPKETQEYTLRAMAMNYANGHSWDHLDGECAVKAADEISALRSMIYSPGKDGGQEVEAVAWQWKRKDESDWHQIVPREGGFPSPAQIDAWRTEEYEVRPLYTRPQPASTALVEKPICHLVWRQGRRAIDDVEDYYEVARPGDKSVDGSDPFPVWASPPLSAVPVVTYAMVEKVCLDRWPKRWAKMLPSERDEKRDEMRRIILVAMNSARDDSAVPQPANTALVEWKVVPDEITNELLAATTKGRQVLAYEKGRYYNAWLEFEQSEGGWLWFDEADSEPNPSHYCELPPEPALSASTSREGER